MEIYADIRQKVQVNPEDVIKKLIEVEIGWRGWIFEEDGNFYRGFKTGGGSHSWDDKETITEGKYSYVKALQFVLGALEEKRR